VGYVEREAFSAAKLVERMEDAALDKAPVWDDLTTFDGKPWRGKVDIISAGFPCQPWSAAGQRKGTEDGRWIWPDVARIVSEVRPAHVFLENVPGLVWGGGLAPILADLSDLGFDAEWTALSARACGAPHRRERVFVLARLSGVGQADSRHDERAQQEVKQAPWRAGVGRSREDELANGDGAGRSTQRPNGERSTEHVGGRGDELAHTQRFGRTEGSSQPVAIHAPQPDALCRGLGQAEPASRQRLARAKVESELRSVDQDGRPRSDAYGSSAALAAGVCLADSRRPEFHEASAGRASDKRGIVAPGAGHGLPLWPPGPYEFGSWGRVLAADPTLEPAICGLADGPSTRMDELRALGNGVVPVVAAVAFLALRERFDSR